MSRVSASRCSRAASSSSWRTQSSIEPPETGAPSSPACGASPKLSSFRSSASGRPVFFFGLAMAPIWEKAAAKERAASRAKGAS
ncbi:hypothetical protein [Roseitalea porphyridii]|uniref:hypothetical protein n=1 Tax=Roseitalea porphyridii TaxID=1852022 RepID=UPI0032F80BDF